jgi:L-ascorbate metabolism protein UlaG (beta-lactamase superfamily)
MKPHRSMSGSLWLTWLGHATAILDFGSARLITDPVLGSRVGPLVRLAPSVEIGEVRPLDGVLLSHVHADHAELETLRRLGRSLPVLAPYGAGNWLRRQGLHAVKELRAGDLVTVAGIRVTATPAAHDGRRWPFGPSADAIGYKVRGSHTVYFAGDTGPFDAMSEMRGSIDAALLPISGWGPTLGPGHLDPEAAARAAALISPRVAVPIHWGTLALRRPAKRPAAPVRPAREFSALTYRYAPEVDVRVLAPGERTEI